MRFLTSDGRLVGVPLVLAITQLIGWGTIGLPAIVGRDLAADLGMSLPAVFGGTSVLYVTMGLCAPWLAKAFARHGARKVMMVGTVVTVTVGVAGRSNNLIRWPDVTEHRCKAT